MTATAHNAMICPSCRSRDTMVTSDGSGLCFACRHEWDPTALVAIVPPELAPFGMATVAEVFGPPPGVDVDEPADLLATLEGSTARLEGGQQALVIGLVDDDTIRVQLPDGRIEDVAFDDVESILPPVEAAATITDDMPDDVARAIAEADWAFAAMALKAGVATLRGEGDSVEIGTPPEGWLWADPDVMPSVERGVALAVASLIAVARLDPAGIVATAEQWLETNKGDLQQEASQ